MRHREAKVAGCAAAVADTGVAGALQPLAAGDVTALLKPPSHGERMIAL
jgi:hypothetical protein